VLEKVRAQFEIRRIGGGNELSHGAVKIARQKKGLRRRRRYENSNVFDESVRLLEDKQTEKM